MKHVVIIHCWHGQPAYCWYPQAARELEAAGFTVSVPHMPQTEMPNLSRWLPVLRDVVKVPDENVYLVGHSAGAVTILRYLESLSDTEHIGGAVLVAPFINDLEHTELRNFFLNPLDFSRIRSSAGKFSIIHSDDDPLIPLLHAVILKEKLGAELVIKHKMQHFSGALDAEDSCKILPEVSEIIIGMSKPGAHMV